MDGIFDRTHGDGCTERRRTVDFVFAQEQRPRGHLYAAGAVIVAGEAVIITVGDGRK
jgi:hypothetical protein